MIIIKKTGQTEVYFYSNQLTKGEFYSDGKYEIHDVYSGDIVSESTVTLSDRGFRHRITVNATNVADLVNERRYEILIYRGDDVVFRDNAIATDQNVSQNDTEKFSWNADKYTYLARPDVNKYKTLTR